MLALATIMVISNKDEMGAAATAPASRQTMLTYHYLLSHWPPPARPFGFRPSYCTLAALSSKGTDGFRPIAQSAHSGRDHPCAPC